MNLIGTNARISIIFGVLLLSVLSACAETNKAPMSLQSGLAPATIDSNNYSRAKLVLQKHLIKEGSDSDRMSYDFVSENQDAVGNVHVKLQPRFDAIPVWSKEVIVHLDKRLELRSISGRVPIIENLDSVPTIDKQAAENSAKDYLSQQDKAWNSRSSSLVVFPDGNQYKLAYLVELYSGLNRQYIFISANDGVVLHQVSGSPSAILK